MPLELSGKRGAAFRPHQMDDGERLCVSQPGQRSQLFQLHGIDGADQNLIRVGREITQGSQKPIFLTAIIHGMGPEEAPSHDGEGDEDQR